LSRPFLAGWLALGLLACDGSRFIRHPPACSGSECDRLSLADAGARDSAPRADGAAGAAGGVADGPAGGTGMGTWSRLSAAPTKVERGTVAWTGGVLLLVGEAMGDPTRRVLSYSPSEDRWRPGAVVPASLIIVGARAAWTGRELWTFGGSPAGGTPTAMGGRYDPAADVWREHPAGPPTRQRHLALWTGSELLVLGGVENLTEVGGFALSEGGEWRMLANVPLGADLGGAWTGRVAFLWGPAHRHLYDPTRDEAQLIDVAGTPPAMRPNARVFWSGTEVLVAGPSASGGGDGAASLQGFDPAAMRWRALGAIDLPASLSSAGAALSGEALFLVGGQAGGVHARGHRFDVAAGTWQDLAAHADLQSLGSPIVEWAGSELLAIQPSEDAPVGLRWQP